MRRNLFDLLPTLPHSTLQLEEIVDVRRWQSDLEAARVRDHGELMRLAQRIESENAAINRELARQGATIAEVLTVVHVRTRSSLLPRGATLSSRLVSSHLDLVLRFALG
jgi:hypothetical protein